MNNSFIAERLRNAEFNTITQKEFNYILENEKLRNILIDSLYNAEFKEDSHFFEISIKAEKLKKDYWDVYEAISITGLNRIRKFFFEDYLRGIITSLYDLGIPQIRTMIEEDKAKYEDEINKILLANNKEHNSIGLIIDKRAARFILDNKLEYLYNCIDLTKFSASFFKDLSFLKVKNKYHSFYVKSFIVDLDMIIYIINNQEDCKFLTTNINFQRKVYTKEEIARFVDNLDKYINECASKEMFDSDGGLIWADGDEYDSFSEVVEVPWLYNSIYNEEICHYIINSKKYRLFKYINVNVLSIEDYKKYIKINGDNQTLSNFDLIKYSLDNKDEEADRSFLELSGLTIEQFLSIKDDLLKKRHLFSFYISGNELIKYIIRNGLKECYEYVSFEFSDIDFEDSDIVNLVELLKYRCLVQREYIEPWSIMKEDTWKKVMQHIILNEEELLKEFSASFQPEVVDFNRENVFKLIELYKKGIIRRPYIIEYLAGKDKKDVEKFLELLKYRKISENEAKTFLDAFQQKVFRSKYKNIVDIFTTIKGLADDKSKTVEEKQLFIKQMVLELRDYIPKYITKELSINNPEYSLLDKKSAVIETLLNKAVLGKARGTELDLLHEITDYYIADKANKYSSVHGVDRLIDLEYNYDIEENRKIIDKDLFNFIRKNYPDLLVKIVKEKGYKKDSIDGSDIKIAKKLFVEWYESELNKTSSILPKKLNFLFKDENFTRSLKKEIIFNKRDLSIKNIEPYFTERELDVLFNTVISDNVIYQKLLDLVSQYKFLEWSTLFKDVIEELYGVTGDDFYTYLTSFATIFKIINNDYIKKEYKKIIEEKYIKGNWTNTSFEEYEKNHREEVIKSLYAKFKTNPNSILKDNFVFNSHSIIYRILLGEDNYRLIKANKGPNEARKDERETILQLDTKRLEKATRYWFKSLELTRCTIPSFSQIVHLGDGKRIRVIVGNRTSPILTTLGERTGSCMRTYAPGDGLYEFCLDDERGFHILFEDSETGEFVSRISGFRNGNILFLNQLRHAVGTKYNDSELVIALRQISAEILKKSREVELEIETPLDSVIADSDMALKKERKEKVTFDKEKATLPRYSDVGEKEIVVLATTALDGSMVPFIENKRNQYMYPAVRLGSRSYVEPSEKADNEFKRIIAMKICYEHRADPYYFRRITDDITIPSYKALIAADDWVVVLKSNMEIEAINVSKDDRAIEEIKEALMEMETIKNNILMKKGELNDTRKVKKSW